MHGWHRSTCFLATKSSSCPCQSRDPQWWLAIKALKTDLKIKQKHLTIHADDGVAKQYTIRCPCQMGSAVTETPLHYSTHGLVRASTPTPGTYAKSVM
jgi:hypothetical protein